MSEGTQTHPMETYEISDRELEALEEAATDSLYITLATIPLALAAASSIAVVVFTFGAGAALVALAVMMAGMVIGALLLLALGIRQRREKRRRIKNLVQEIRSRRKHLPGVDGSGAGVRRVAKGEHDGKQV